MGCSIPSGTRREYIHVGSTSTSMSQTVPEEILQSIGKLGRWFGLLLVTISF